MESPNRHPPDGELWYIHEVAKTLRTSSEFDSPIETAEGVLVRIGRTQSRTLLPALHIRLDTLPLLRVGRGTADGFRRSQDQSGFLSLLDVAASERHATITRIAKADQKQFLLEDLGSTNGTFVNGTRVQRHLLTHGQHIEFGHTLWRFLERPIQNYDALVSLAYSGGMVGPESSFSLEQLAVLDAARRIATSQVSVVLYGPSGSGKEVLAHLVHSQSGRKGPFLAINCAAIPRGLIESELFGHRRGAFTGATGDKKGVLEEADGGTLLLDEIGDMPLAVQATLLRALQEHCVTRVGEATPRPIDVRVLAATHKNLELMVEREEFRGDLLSRIRGLTLELPPLRRRTEDLLLLLWLLLSRHASEDPPTVSHEAVRGLLCHDWPFNVRELEQALVSALALSGGASLLDRTHFGSLVTRVRNATLDQPSTLSSGTMLAASPVLEDSGVWKRPGHKVDDATLLPKLTDAMTRHEGNISAVARELHTTRAQVHRWATRLGIDPETFRNKLP